MTSKLRRPPLFTYSDGSICLSSYPQYATCKVSKFPSSCYYRQSNV